MFDILGSLFGQKLTEVDIPSANAIRKAFLEVLSDGKARSFKSICDLAEKRLDVTNKQRAFKVNGSSAPLLTSRFEHVWTALQNEGLISRSLIPGRMKLTSAGRGARQSNNADAARSPSKRLIDKKLACTVDADATAVDEPVYEMIDDDVDLAKTTPVAPAAQHERANEGCAAINFASATAAAPKSVAGNKPANSRKGVTPLASLILERPAACIGGAAVALCLSGVVALAVGGGSAPAKNQVPNEPETIAAPTKADKKTDGVLSFTLEPETDVPNLCFQVLVDGKTADGEAIHEYYSAEVGTKYALEYGAGVYALSVVSGTLTHNDVVYKASEVSVDFDAESDKALELRISKDTEATAALAAQKQKEAEQKAAEEAAAKKAAEEEAAAKAAEEQRRAEEEAAAKAAEEEAAAKAAEEQRRADEAARLQAEKEAEAAKQSRTVYITKTGEKYHNGSCRHLRKSKIEISLSDAIARGYEACGTCGG
ncbi:hypothetical protein [Paratractidigestivibacter sp.]|uniref:hypothetical protein n=1 Tax=Paratractidigestivibacter sp. TaxID=2847316 RepID=UPI002ACB0892|nr:hypothetical protein [Paratractidigestivibacter sp.]